MWLYRLNNKPPRAGLVVSFASAFLTQWKKVHVLGAGSSTISAGNLEHWIKPRIGCVKVNCDATIFKNSAQFGVGWLARYENGELIQAVNKCFLGTPEIHVAEAIGIREALSWVKREKEEMIAGNANQQMHYLIESDCQLAVKAIQNRETIHSPFGGAISDCRFILESLNNVEIVFVKRSGNRAADWLARASSSNPGCIFRGGFVPSDLLCILDADLF